MTQIFSSLLSLLQTGWEEEKDDTIESNNFFPSSSTQQHISFQFFPPLQWQRQCVFWRWIDVDVDGGGGGALLFIICSRREVPVAVVEEGVAWLPESECPWCGRWSSSLVCWYCCCCCPRYYTPTSTRIRIRIRIRIRRRVVVADDETHNHTSQSTNVARHVSPLLVVGVGVTVWVCCCWEKAPCKVDTWRCISRKKERRIRYVCMVRLYLFCVFVGMFKLY